MDNFCLIRLARANLFVRYNPERMFWFRGIMVLPKLPPCFDRAILKYTIFFTFAYIVVEKEKVDEK